MPHDETDDSKAATQQTTEPKFLVFWYFSGSSHWESYDTLDEAQEARASYARSYPRNTYGLAQILSEIGGAIRG